MPNTLLERTHGLVGDSSCSAQIRGKKNCRKFTSVLCVLIEHDQCIKCDVEWKKWTMQKRMIDVWHVPSRMVPSSPLTLPQTQYSRSVPETSTCMTGSLSKLWCEKSLHELYSNTMFVFWSCLCICFHGVLHKWQECANFSLGCCTPSNLRSHPLALSCFQQIGN